MEGKPAQLIAISGSDGARSCTWAPSPAESENMASGWGERGLAEVLGDTHPEEVRCSGKFGVGRAKVGQARWVRLCEGGPR